ncbi:MAG: geranylgeranylglycerol-phosphate geranylgeranyltransferase [Flavobacteriaceae bacterium]|nr:geranylgeranylglycerol-phosphate geranylgeranyltransferase [Flavobacteriaceae bacterium]
MLSRRNKLYLKKLFSLFSVVRGYNIFIIVVAQYLTSIYIIAPEKPLKQVLFDSQLFILILATAMVIAGGYIINNFYDSEKDLINRPIKSMLDRLVSQNTKLSVYFVLNFLTVIFASYVSFRAVLFFSVYIFAIWFYSHKIKKYPFIGNILASMLAILPFFAVFVYYKNFQTVIFVHGLFLILLISMRELIKDLENLRGDLALNYQTIPVVYGIRFSKTMLTILVVLTLLPIFLLIFKYDIGKMYYYFYFSLLLLSIFLIILWKSSSKKHYLLLHNILKFIIVIGVFSIPLINVNLLLSRLHLLSV